MTHLQIQAQVAKTSAFDGSSIDVSAITQDWTLVLEVLNLTAGATARFVFEDSADGFSSDIAAGPSFSVTGQVGDGGGLTTSFDPSVIRFSIKKKDFPDLRFGVTSGHVRLSLTRISGSSPSVVYQAYAEY